MALITTIGGIDTDSFATVVEYHAYVLQMYNVDLSSNSISKDEANLRTAFQIQELTWDWKGYRVSETQAASFPRNISEFVDGVPVANDSIPVNVKKAQMELAYSIEKGIDISPIIEGGTVRSESVGAGPAKVTTKYDEILEVPRITRVENLLRPYHNGRSGGTGSEDEVIRG
jgi:hypothetical protein